MTRGSRRAAATIGAVLTLLSTRALAEPPAAANRARAGDFMAIQVATTDPDRLMADWQKPGAGIRLVTATTMMRNQPIVTFIVFGGCKPDAAGACNVTADFETIGPAGKTYDETRMAEVWVGHPAPPSQVLQLSVGALGLRIEDKDALGPYRVRATITDHVAGAVLHTEQVLTARAP